MWTDHAAKIKTDIKSVSPKILWKHILTWECVHTRGTELMGARKKERPPEVTYNVQQLPGSSLHYLRLTPFIVFDSEKKD